MSDLLLSSTVPVIDLDIDYVNQRDIPGCRRYLDRSPLLHNRNRHSVEKVQGAGCAAGLGSEVELVFVSSFLGCADGVGDAVGGFCYRRVACHGYW